VHRLSRADGCGAQTEAVRAGRIVPVRVDQLIADAVRERSFVGAVGVRSLRTAAAKTSR